MTSRTITGISLRLWAVIFAGWLGFNLCAVAILDSRAKRSNEIEFGLPQYSLDQFSEERIRGEATAEFRFRLLRPDQPELGQAYPVVVFLHGSGESGNDNVAQLRGLPVGIAMHQVREKYPAYWVIPQCPANCSWLTYLNTPLGTANSDSVAQRLIGAIEQQPHADMSRLYLVGYSMGSFGTWEWIAQDANRFAAAIPISGGASSELAPHLKRVPIRAIHGVKDNVCPVQATQELVAGINSNGGNANFIALEATGHDTWPELLNDQSHFQWLFSQRRSQVD